MMPDLSFGIKTVLPVTAVYSTLVKTLKNHDMVLLQAPPGAGKSTWLPLQLIRDGVFKHIVMLEPRRLAARNIASYLAQLQNEKIGMSIGLRIRQEKYVSRNTKLEIVTEGMLTRMLQNDPELSGVDCIIFDEFHERSVAVDTALAFALESQDALRDDLTILLMSATLDADRIVAKFDCPVISSQGRSFPIAEIYHPLRDDKRWLDEVPLLVKKAIEEQAGSCLVFLPGRREINRVAQQLSDLEDNIHICPLYGDQSKIVQQAAISPAKNGQRKIVLATNVAETSLTIEGIRIVIDSGKKRAAKFNLNTGVTELKTVNISMSSAIQRAGRAGRIEPGVVYRLGSKETFNRRELHDIPDILSSDISQLLLETKQWGADLNQLTFLDPPSLPQQQQGNDLLLMLEAVDDQQKLTTLGKQMLQLGTDIRWAHMLIKAKQLDATLPGIESLSIYLLALLDSRVSQQAELSSGLQAQLHSPHPTFTKQLKFWLKRLNNRPCSQLKMSLLPLVVALAYPDRLAKRRGEGYRLANGAGVDCRRDNWLNDEFIAIAELGGQQGKHIFSATAVDIHQLEETLPHLFRQRQVCEFSEKSGRFTYENRLMLNAIVVNKKTINSAIDEKIRTTAWIDLIRRKGFALFDCFSHNLADRNTNEFNQLLIRMTLAHQHFPDDYPLASEIFLLTTLDSWLSPFLSEVKNIEQLKKVDLIEPLKNCFDWKLQTALDLLLPKRVLVPSGSNLSISYQLGGPARLSVRMQEVYGLSSSPQLCKGKVSLLIDLLSPAHRSLQLTQDLEGFWKGSYHAIQKEMKGRYPRHFWPDDPAHAKATSKTKAKM
jgi:ATP-dependent helicase HrpB